MSTQTPTENPPHPMHSLLTSKQLRDFEQNQRARCESQKEALPSGILFNQIDSVTLDIADQFYDLINDVEIREQVPLEKFGDEAALQKEFAKFAALKSKIADRDALYVELKKLHQQAPESPMTPSKKIPPPHDPKKGPEPANHYTKAASAMIERYMKMDDFQSIKVELEGIFELLIIQANRHLELQKEKEDKILDQNLELADYRRELNDTSKKTTEAEREATSARAELTSAQQKIASLTARTEQLDSHISAQNENAIVWTWEKDGFEATIADLEKRVEELSAFEKRLLDLGHTSDRKDLEILELKKNLAAKSKEVSQWKNTCCVKDESLKQATKQLRGNEEETEVLRKELGEKEHEIRTLKSSQQSPPSRSSPANQSTSSQYSNSLQRRIDDLVRDQTQAANTNKCLRDKDVQHQDTIKRLKNQLDNKDDEIRNLQMEAVEIRKKDVENKTL